MILSRELAAWDRPFNSPLESGLRSLVILVAAFPGSLDLQRLSSYDYLIVHSGDVDGGPPSLHPSTPHRAGELLVRRGLVEAGLLLMRSRALIEQRFTETGISYLASDAAAGFLDSLDAIYTRHLCEMAQWVVHTFAAYDNSRLNEFIRGNLGRWGAEFDYEAVLREVPR